MVQSFMRCGPSAGCCTDKLYILPETDSLFGLGIRESGKSANFVANSATRPGLAHNE